MRNVGLFPRLSFVVCRKLQFFYERNKGTSRASCTRRVVISSHCFIQIELDPLRPSLIPTIKLLGSDKLAQPLMEALNR
jgi:hypothetical protein